MPKNIMKMVYLIFVQYMEYIMQMTYWRSSDNKLCKIMQQMTSLTKGDRNGANY